MHQHYGVDPEAFNTDYEAWASLLHPEDRADAELVSRQAVAGDRDYRTEFRIVRPDGEIRHIRAEALIRRDEQGRPVQIGRAHV